MSYIIKEADLFEDDEKEGEGPHVELTATGIVRIRDDSWEWVALSAEQAQKLKEFLMENT